MQEFADFYKIRVDVRYWLIPSVNTGANTGRRGQGRSSSQPPIFFHLKNRILMQLVSIPVSQAGHAGSSPVYPSRKLLKS